jgi:hypothetical protein
MPYRLAAVLCLSLALAAAADERVQKPAATAPKPAGSVSAGGTARPWLYTDDERITRRFPAPAADPHSRTLSQIAGYSEAVDGRQRPELFLPYELFDALLRGLEPDQKPGQHVRALVDGKLARFGYEPTTFWSTLRRVSAPYLNAKKESREKHHGSMMIAGANGSKILIPVSQEACSARAVALVAARQELGGQDFDRFLYSAVAPDLNVASSGSSAGRSEQLRFMANGCK